MIIPTDTYVGSEVMEKRDGNLWVLFLLIFCSIFMEIDFNDDRSIQGLSKKICGRRCGIFLRVRKRAVLPVLVPFCMVSLGNLQEAFCGNR